MAGGDCPHCGGDIVGGACRNCGVPGVAAAAPDMPEEMAFDAIPEVGDDFPLAAAGLAAVIKAAGDDPKRPELARTADRAVRTLLSMTAGYEADPASAFEASNPTTRPLKGVTLHLHHSVPMRTACEQCMMPVFGTVSVRCTPRDRPLDGSHIARVVGILSSRFQTEAQLAEQVAGAVVQMGGASSASVQVTACRPCDDCGAGRAETTARARRTAPENQ